MTDPAQSYETNGREPGRDSQHAASVYAESIFETSREPLLLMDEGLRIRAANRAFYQSFQVSPTETIGQRIFEVGNGQWNIPRLSQLLEDILPRNGHLFDFEVTHEFPHIGQRIMLVNARQVYPTAGSEQGICLAIEDITEKQQAREIMRLLNVQLEERVRQRTMQLETANHELEAFSYSVSHDLRSPLRALEGYARILLEEHAPTFTSEVQEYVRDISRNAKKMGHLIDDLLAFSQLTRQSLEVRAVAPGPIVRHILHDFRAQRDTQNIEVIVGELPHCRADPSLLKQVWINLLSNAFKYTSKCKAPRIEVGCQMQDGEQVFFVRDNGAGFDMKFAGKLFGVFQRLHKSKDFDGTGVGLAIVQRIVHRHGGRVWADAAVNKGATFSFTLPLVDQLP